MSTVGHDRSASLLPELATRLPGFPGTVGGAKAPVPFSVPRPVGPS